MLLCHRFQCVVIVTNYRPLHLIFDMFLLFWALFYPYHCVLSTCWWCLHNHGGYWIQASVLLIPISAVSLSSVFTSENSWINTRLCAACSVMTFTSSFRQRPLVRLDLSMMSIALFPVTCSVLPSSSDWAFSPHTSLLTKLILFTHHQEFQYLLHLTFVPFSHSLLACFHFLPLI